MVIMQILRDSVRSRDGAMGSLGESFSVRSPSVNLQEVCSLIGAFYPDSIWEWDIVDEQLLSHLMTARNLEKYLDSQNQSIK